MEISRKKSEAENKLVHKIESSNEDVRKICNLLGKYNYNEERFKMYINGRLLKDTKSWFRIFYPC